MYEPFKNQAKKIITGEHINDIFDFIYQFSPRRPRLLLTAAGVSGLTFIALGFIEVMHNQTWLYYYINFLNILPLEPKELSGT